LSCLQGISRAHSSFLGALQDAQYLQYGVLSEVSMAALGNVACLSGTAILVRLDALLAVFDEYVNSATSGETASLYEHWKRQYGDDRHLAQLLSLRFGPWATDIHTDTVAMTEAALPLKNWILQRRRWFLGTIATDAAALCNPAFWYGMPLHSAYRLCVRALAVTNLDLQMVLLCLVGSCLQIGELSRVATLQVGVFWVANILVLSAFDPVRDCLKVFMYPLVVLVSPFINATSYIWALVSLWERRW
jgi:cellulose synthase/poly-beta-1,6-N-acetylglucosamine synthase-like glycosyltransferase